MDTTAEVASKRTLSGYCCAIPCQAMDALCETTRPIVDGAGLRKAGHRNPNPHRSPQSVYRSWHTCHQARRLSPSGGKGKHVFQPICATKPPNSIKNRARSYGPRGLDVNTTDPTDRTLSSSLLLAQVSMLCFYSVPVGIPTTNSSIVEMIFHLPTNSLSNFILWSSDRPSHLIWCVR